MFLIKLTPKSLEKSLPSLCLNVPISREPIQVLIEKNEKILFDFQARWDFLQWLSTQNKVHEHLLLSCYFLFNLCKVLPLSLQDSRPKERHRGGSGAARPFPNVLFQWVQDSNLRHFQTFSLPKSFLETQDKAKINITSLRGFYCNILD